MRRSFTRPGGLVATAVVLALVGAGPTVAQRGHHSARPVNQSSTSAASDVGTWRVTQIGPSSYRLSWQSPRQIPVGDALAQMRVAGVVRPAVVGRDGRTVSVTVTSPVAPDPSRYDVLLGSKVLDERVLDRGASTKAPYRAPAGVQALLDDPGKPGTHAITTSDYELAPVKLPDIPQLSEMIGHIVAPVDATSDSPLVLFLHGRHGACYDPNDNGGGGHILAHSTTAVWACPDGQLPIPSYLGYDYVQRLLASQGYVTVSISANAINDLDYHAFDGGASARAALIRDHLRAWVDFAANDEHPADLSNVILVGHSRGGEGANRASLNLPTNEGYAVTGQVLIGPTDFAFQAAPAIPTVTILPYCDGDVSDLEGQNFTDDGRDLGADLAFHSSVLVMGANHNFFNTEWTPGISAAPSFDDWGGRKKQTCGTESAIRLSAAQQRLVGKTYIAGAVHLFASGDESVLPMFDGSAVAVPSAGSADVRSHAIGGGLLTRRPGLDGNVTTGATALARLCVGVAESRSDAACEKRVSSARTPHWPGQFFPGVPLRQYLEVGWDTAGQEAGLALKHVWDLSDDSELDLRTIVDPAQGPVRVAVKLTDENDDSAVVTPLGGGNLSPLPGGSYSLAKRWGQDLKAPLAGVSGIDLGAITDVSVVSKNDTGRVWIVDMSATPNSGVSTAPTSAIPLLSIGTVNQTEGDGTGTATASVPYTIRGQLQHDAVVRLVSGVPFSSAHPDVQRLVIPAGTTSGHVDVEYQPNDLDDRGRVLIGLTAYPVRGIETDRYIGGAWIIDDDPTPKLSVRAAATRVTEGDPATWTITLAKPVNYFVYAVGRPVKAVGGPQLLVKDLTKKYRERHLPRNVDLNKPVYKTRLRLFIFINDGKVSKSVSIPTRSDNTTDPPRSISVRFRAPHFDITNPIRTIKVTDG